jgi:hypothetical protein
MRNYGYAINIDMLNIYLKYMDISKVTTYMPLLLIWF